MSNRVIQVIRPSTSLRVVLGLASIVGLVFAVLLLLVAPFPKSLLLSILFLVFSAIFRSSMMTMLKITSKTVVYSNLFGQEILFLTNIKRVQVEYHRSMSRYSNRLYSVLIVETENAEIQVGWCLNEDEIRAAAVCILEQIKETYPENYDYVREDRYNAERFWRK